MAQKPTPRLTCLIVSLLFQLGSVLVLMIIMHSVDRWVSSEDENYGFTGGVIYMKSNDAHFQEYAIDETYSYISKTLCSTTPEDDEPYESLCRVFETLNAVGTTLICLDTSIMTIDVVIMIVVAAWFEDMCGRPTVILPITGTLLHLITVMAYMLAKSITFSGNCDTLLDDDQIGVLCAGPSTEMLLVSLFYHLIIYAQVVLAIRMAHRQLHPPPSLPVTHQADPPAIMGDGNSGRVKDRAPLSTPSGSNFGDHK